MCQDKTEQIIPKAERATGVLVGQEDIVVAMARMVIHQRRLDRVQAVESATAFTIMAMRFCFHCSVDLVGAGGLLMSLGSAVEVAEVAVQF